MSRPTVPALIQFGSTSNPASEIGQFGSYASPDFSGSLTVMQSGTAWPRGWFAAVQNNNRQFIQDQNAVDFVFCSYLFYIMTLGVPEYIAAMTYWTNSIIQVAGQFFISLTDNNTGNTPASSPTQWQSGIPGMEISGVIKAYAGAVAPTGYLLCNGQAVSRTTYAALFTICGTAYGAGDGTTTFNVPNFQGQQPMSYVSGDPNFGTIGGVGGQQTINLSHDHVMQGDGGAAGPVDDSNYSNRVKISGGNLYGITGGQSAQGVSTTVSTTGNAAQSIINPYQTIGSYIIKT